MLSHELPAMPSLADQIDLLRTEGHQFSPEERDVCLEAFPDLSMPSDGEPALYDARLLPETPIVIAPSLRHYAAISAVRGEQPTYRTGSPLSEWSPGGLILGFSGYGTSGFSYEVEYEGIRGIFEHCVAEDIPVDAVVDGGTGFGVPGLSGALARQHGVTTVGYVPLRSMRGIAPRDKLVVVGDEFGDEAGALGCAPDILIALGGKANALKEVETALTVGGLVLLLNLKEYASDSVAHILAYHEQAQRAQAAGKLVVCESLDDVAESFSNYDWSGRSNQRGLRQQWLDIKLGPSL